MPAAARKLTSGDPRSVAARLLQQVLAGRSLSEQLPHFLPQLEDGRDRGLVQAISFGVMRTYHRLHHLEHQLLSKPLKARDRDIEALILMGLYQLLYLRVGDHAAVHETAGAANKLGKRWAVGLINGVLRSFLRRREGLLADLERHPEALHAMPAWLLRAVQTQWPDGWQKPVEALNSHPPMSLRVNRQVQSRQAYLQLLHDSDIGAEPIPHTESGINLIQAVDVADLPGFAQGHVSVQDGAAQLAAGVMDLAPGQQVLDACAAPGGKSCHMLELEPGIRLTALDSDPERLQQVRENLTRIGLQAVLERGDAADPAGSWAERCYDRILLDVPCSATGVIRRHPDIKYLRRESDIGDLAKLQGAILDRVWRLLKPGGRMLYATCSLLPRENELQLERFLRRQRDAQEDPMDVAWGESRPVGRQIAPGEGNMDGFYYARLVKRAS
ncbi:MAG: 16S rRNA (cytosine(967)-C(5))-methyltransferase [gamma proteobacterium symbiont of Ctena orbiculata]|nr:MAG: 16S rRNA (cytosine(967)-C(5))-methyltransferase [gamma proteobacterium symbiont of Ctena orbiculata]